MKRPHILIIMVDQLNGTLFPDGAPAPFLHLPHLRALAERSTTFTRNYTASPLCGPGRAAFMSGRLPSKTGVYDNAAEFSSAIPTYAHHLRRIGYRTILSGKMHFVGADQLHGFEERLTTDIYPADFGWTPDYRKPGQRIDWWYHNLGSVTHAGVAETSNQMEYDDEVTHFAVQRIRQLSRRADDRPWCLTVSFTHPHDPYVCRRRFWDLYADCPALEPTIPALPFEQQDPHSQRLHIANDYQNHHITPDHIRRSRRAYFANLSYLDEKIGELLTALQGGHLIDDTVILFCSDHGDMLGERGLWFKMSFLEGSARTPLLIAAPSLPAIRIDTPVSNLDITPTLAEIAGIDLTEIAPWTDGESIHTIITNRKRQHPVPMEYAAEGSHAPLVALIDDEYKLIRCALDKDLLYRPLDDPNELTPLTDAPQHQQAHQRISALIDAKWDLPAFDRAVRQSQASRLIVYPALRNGSYYPWDFQPLQQASERYMRNHKDLNQLEHQQRYPRDQ